MGQIPSKKFSVPKSSIVCKGCKKTCTNILMHFSKTKNDCESFYKKFYPKELASFREASVDKRKLKVRKSQEKNREKILESNKKYKKENKEKIAASNKKYRKENK